MISFNTKEVLQQIEEDKLKPKPSIKIEIGKKKASPAPEYKITGGLKPEQIVVNFDDIESSPETKVVSKSSIVSKSWEEFNQAKLERAKLSNEISKLIDQGATRSELAQHYEKIVACEPELQELFDKARHVEQYGALPELKTDEQEKPVDIYSLKDERRKLIDKRCKLQKKIKIGEAKNPKKVIEWQLELDQANAHYNHIDEQIKKLEGKA
jgi:hypothetical protein